MTTLLVGFDSAWTPTNSGALVALLQADDGKYQELGLPQAADFNKAENIILEWQAQHGPQSTLILLDQPTIVKDSSGQRHVEHLVRSLIGRRRGGVQPANTSRTAMFGAEAPVWRFLNRFGGAADPLKPASLAVIETYPALTLIALNWILQDTRPKGRLPKYNPMRKATFSICDWQFVCERTLKEFHERKLWNLCQWLEGTAGLTSPRKIDQDRLDACICLLVALYLAELRDCLMVGNLSNGYMVVPHGLLLLEELQTRCTETGRTQSTWVRPFQLGSA